MVAMPTLREELAAFEADPSAFRTWEPTMTREEAIAASEARFSREPIAAPDCRKFVDGIAAAEAEVEAKKAAERAKPKQTSLF